MEIRPFRYMAWAKAHYFDTEHSLVPSGMPYPGPEDLQVPEVDPFQEVPCDGEGSIQEDVARAHAMPLESTLVCAGSTQADHHIYAALLVPGDEVLVETPAYELFACLASVQGVGVRSFVRRPEANFDLEVAEIERALTPRTKLVVLTSVHNPSGRVACEAVLRELGELCERRDLWALVCEVYLDFLPGTTVGPGGEPPARRNAHAIHPRLISTNSMTKVYGLGSVRIGWMFGDPALVARCHEVREILSPLLPALPVAVAREALARRHHLLGRAQARAAEGRAILSSMLADADGFTLVPPQAGIMSFVRVNGVDDTMRYTDWLRETHRVGAVPGEQFGLPGWLRIGYGREPEQVRTALQKLLDA